MLRKLGEPATVRVQRTFARTVVIGAVCTIVGAVGCRNDEGAATDQAGQDLRKAQAVVTDKSKDLVTNQDEIERKKRELVTKQQELVDQEKSLEDNRQQLGSARGTLADARLAYGVAVAERFAKLDASLAGLATRTDVKSKDAVVGLRARRDLLAAEIAKLPGTTAPSWTGSTHDVDITFDAIEHDLRAAKQ